MTDQTPKPKKPKQPQDHKPKQPKPKEGVRILQSHGRDWEVAEESLDDFELLADFGALEDGNPSRLPSALKRLLGPEQYRDAIELLRDPDTNRVSVEAGAGFFRDLFEQQ